MIDLKFTYFIIVLFCFNLFVSGANDNEKDSLLANKEIIVKDSIHNAEDIRLANNDNLVNNSYVILGTESTYRERLEKLNNMASINMEYNSQVKKYIEYYITKRSVLISQVIGLSKLYFPIFEECLEKRNMPFELKYLAVIESALNPVAKSSSNAIGLWQFLFSTGKMLDMNINNYIDERQDPIKSTEAALMYLDFLYREFNDWQLAIAAYNGGPMEIKKAIIRSGGKKTFWELAPYLPKQTQNYVPAFIAMAYVMNYAKEHNIFPTSPKFTYYQIDTVMINEPVYFSKISKILNISIDTLRFLNPSYKFDYIPKSDNPVALTLPKTKILEFVKNKDLIINKSININKPDNNIKYTDTKGKTKIIHVVEHGDYFNKIAIKYNCTTNDIKSWNNITNEGIHPGQQLCIWANK